MRIFSLFVIIFGIALAGGSLFYADKFLTERANYTSHIPETVKILVASESLSQGDLLSARQLKWVEWPGASVPDGAFASTEALFGSDHNDKRYVTRSIEPGEPILDARISAPNQVGSIKDKLPPGYRAVSIRVSDVTSVSGFIAVGDRVDVLLLHSPEGQLVSKVFLEDIEVLAVDQISDSERNNPRLARTVTILVTTRQAQLISLAQQEGQLSLMLRGDEAAVAGGEKAPSINLDDLNGITREAPAPGKSVRVRQGASDVQEIKLP
jgi:pilus assembly protein CpaB